MSKIKADTVETLAGANTSMANVVNGSAKAWVNFNGTGTVAIRAAYNVSSITDNAGGQYTVNFTSAFSDANYSAASAGVRSRAVIPDSIVGGYPASASAFIVYSTNAAAGFEDFTDIMLSFFR